MALIKCPQCGQTVLSVASTCPKCSYLFLEAPKEESAAGALVECRRCSKRIPPDSATCPYCAYPIRRVVVMRRAAVTAGVAGLALAAIVFAVARRGGPDPAVASVTTHPETTTRSAAPAQVSADSGVSSADPTTSTPASRDTSGTLVASTATPRTSAARPRQPSPDSATVPSRPRPSLPRSAGARQSRWSLNWVNVREGRGTANAIVTVLRPGIEVELADQRGGWWAVYVDGTFVGYASGSLFGAEPPSTNGIR